MQRNNVAPAVDSSLLFHVTLHWFPTENTRLFPASQSVGEEQFYVKTSLHFFFFFFPPSYC